MVGCKTAIVVLDNIMGICWRLGTESVSFAEPSDSSLVKKK